RGLPPGRPGGAGGGGRRVVRRRERLAIHAVRLRRAPGEGGPDPRGAPRGRHGSDPDGQPRPAPALLRPAPGVPEADGRAGAGEHVVQHGRRADRLHPARRGRVLLDLAAGRAGHRLVLAGEARAVTPLSPGRGAGVSGLLSELASPSPPNPSPAAGERGGKDIVMRASVVVPTYRRPELLERCLGALVAQDFDPSAYEVIVADDAASGPTRPH